MTALLTETIARPTTARSPRSLREGARATSADEPRVAGARSRPSSARTGRPVRPEHPGREAASMRSVRPGSRGARHGGRAVDRASESARSCRLEAAPAASRSTRPGDLDTWQPGERGMRLVLSSLVVAASAGAVCVAHTAWVVMG